MSGILASMIGGGIGELMINITDTANPNIPALVTAAGWLGTMQKIRIVSTGLVNTLSIPASLDGADITLDFSSASFVGGTYNGGTALKTRAHIKVSNTGTLAGGGSAGNRGGNAWVRRTLSNGVQQSANGYGGAGGNGQGFEPGSLTVRAAQDGQPGTQGTLQPTGDFGGGGGGRGSAYASGGDGGGGGGWGADGQLSPSREGSVSGDYDASGVQSAGGAGLAGLYIDGNSYVTWLATGTRLGRSA